MKLISCHIENFGKLHDLTYEFSSKVNVINAENGYGKSTLAAFIKVMFYGFDNEKKRDVFENERKRYSPWQKGPYGGSIRFEKDGRQYSVARIFGAKESEDSYSLRNAVTNLETDEWKGNLGEELFGIDSESFKRTIYISQSDAGTHATDSINAKMGNISLMTNDLANYDKVDLMLKDSLNAISPKRSTGELSKLKSRITELDAEIKRKNQIERSLKEIADKKAAGESEYKELKDKQNSLAEKSRLLTKKNELRLKKAEYYSLLDKADSSKEKVFSYTLTATEEEKLKRTNEIFSGNVPSDEDMKNNAADISSIRSLAVEERQYLVSDADRKRYEELSELFRDSEITEKDASSAIADMNEAAMIENSLKDKDKLLQAYEREKLSEEKRQRVRSSLILVAAGIIFGLGGVVLIMHKALTLSVILLLAGLVCIVFGLYMKFVAPKKDKAEVDHSTDKIDDLKSEMDRDRRNAERLRNNISSILGLSDIEADKSDAERLAAIRALIYEYEELAHIIREKESASRLSEIQMINERVRSFLGGFYYMEEEPLEKAYVITDSYIRFLEETHRKLEDDIEDYTELSGKKAEYMRAIKGYEERKKAADNYLKITAGLADFLNEEDAEDDDAEDSGDVLSGINQKIEEYTESLEKISRSLLGYERQEDDLYSELEQIRVYEDELEEAGNREKELLEKERLITMTRSLLREAKENFTAQYMAPLLSAFSKYYKKLSLKEADNYNIDADMKLSVKEFGADRDVGFLSRGNQDLVGIAFRMALIEAMYKEEKPFIIYDDPFTDLDEEKVKCGIEFVKEISEDYQVIYFTCHSSREIKD
ncbi:MAG: AAA family ATPase [Eubacterium sp.]|nr:AAA family ATPase [Eubacterium sp.]